MILVYIFTMLYNSFFSNAFMPWLQSYRRRLRQSLSSSNFRQLLIRHTLHVSISTGFNASDGDNIVSIQNGDPLCAPHLPAFKQKCHQWCFWFMTSRFFINHIFLSFWSSNTSYHIQSWIISHTNEVSWLEINCHLMVTLLTIIGKYLINRLVVINHSNSLATFSPLLLPKAMR